MSHPKKVLVLGSGAIKIGEAGEFDYSGSQALKALKEEGIETILVNSNIATVQTDLADKVYLLPVEPEYVARVIEKERPDGILLGFGGQTALNCGTRLAKSGVLEKFGVAVLGTPVHAIEEADDRGLFRKAMVRASVPVLQSFAVHSVEDALKAAESIGYPVMLRVAYTLGGRGTGVAHDKVELENIAANGLAQSMIRQVLVEEYVGGWKEVEYEIVRDWMDNCIIVCNMENFDPMGVHTGDSIVVAPSQTLNNREYQMLRDAAIRAARSLGIVGECNIQFALDPNSERYRAIELNSRLSRSSALASKATGYPLAYVAAKLAIGHTLLELKNKVTGKTTACFEPALDYIVVKMPRWDFDKFPSAERKIGTEMRSVGEVMAIGRTFEEALQKAVRMTEVGRELFSHGKHDAKKLKGKIATPTDRRLFQIADAMLAGESADEIHGITKIDKWFLDKIGNIAGFWSSMSTLDGGTLLRAKRLGFSDAAIAEKFGKTEEWVRRLRLDLKIVPFVKQIDTSAAEWPASTNYLYLTYNGSEDDPIADSGRKKIVVLGSGTFRIGSSVEFDWCSVNAVRALRKKGIGAVMVNCNPETVSTDYDVSDRLYFEEITLERTLDIWEKEKPDGMIVSVGGQTPNNLAMPLFENGVKILGTPVKDIDRAEDRAKFSSLLDELGIKQPEWKTFTSLEEAEEFCKSRYPVLVRPSYVLSGAAMRVAGNKTELDVFLEAASNVSGRHPVTISKFVENAREVEVDGVSDGKRVLVGSVIEHIENAGVHSGDSTMVIPPISIGLETMEKILADTEKIAIHLGIKGPFNIQYLVDGEGEPMVIECNLRASRSMPFVSKVTGVNLIELATGALLGEPLVGEERWMALPRFGIKVAQFSFARLRGADPVLGVEMASTGEVACVGRDWKDALLKAMEAAQANVPRQGTILLTPPNDSLEKKFRELEFSVLNAGSEDIERLIMEKKIAMLVSLDSEPSGRKMRRLAVDYGIPLMTNRQLLEAALEAIKEKRAEPLGIEHL